MLTVHHLGISQSERIVWLCEELGLDYTLKRYDRRADNRLAPDEYKALHPMGIAPVITDGDLVLGESGAICDYIIARYGKGRLVPAPDHPEPFRAQVAERRRVVNKGRDRHPRRLRPKRVQTGVIHPAGIRGKRLHLQFE